jgi:O-antigen ligase
MAPETHMSNTMGTPKRNVPWLLRFCVISIFIFPADMIFGPIGAIGYVAMILALLLFATWVASSLLGIHNPLPLTSPVRVALAALWLATACAYIAMPTAGLTDIQRASADRWVLVLCGVSGLVLVTAETVRSLHAALQLVRALVLGATFCSAVALYQFLTSTDPSDWVRSAMVGMEENGGNTTFQVRSSFMRVAGTTFTPIELGVVACMVLPLSIWRAIFDSRGRAWWHWLQASLVALAAIMTVSRSAILGLTIVVVVFTPLLPQLARRWAALIIPLGVALVFVSVPGFVSTIASIFTAGTSDPSLTTRLNNYPRVEALFLEAPLTGQGPATYIPDDALQILDNQYLHTAVEMGIIGVMAVILFLGVPVLAACQVAWCVHEPMLRSLAGAVAAASAVAMVTSGTFDSFSFPVFMIVFPVVAGLAGSVWSMAKNNALTA